MTGRKAEVEDKANVLHRGIATRAFERRFQLADHVRAVEAVTENGLLHIDLVREVPEALKPRKIEIARGKAIESPGRRVTRDADEREPADRPVGGLFRFGAFGERGHAVYRDYSRLESGWKAAGKWLATFNRT